MGEGCFPGFMKSLKLSADSGLLAPPLRPHPRTPQASSPAPRVLQRPKDARGPAQSASGGRTA